jgi:hypothetical protein
MQTSAAQPAAPSADIMRIFRAARPGVALERAAPAPPPADAPPPGGTPQWRPLMLMPSQRRAIAAVAACAAHPRRAALRVTVAPRPGGRAVAPRGAPPPAAAGGAVGYGGSHWGSAAPAA